MYSYEIIKLSDMKDKIKNLKTVCKPGNPIRFDGFLFFGPGYILHSIHHRPKEELEKEVYFTAFYEDKIVGVILFVEVEPNVWRLKLIDVHKDHKRKGIATNLYKLVNSWVKPHYVLYADELSTEEGKSARLYDVRLREVTNCINFRDREEYEKAKREGKLLS